MTYAEQLAQTVEYDDEGEGSVDSLIAYKNALEDTLEAVEQALRSRGLAIEDLLRSRTCSEKAHDARPLSGNRAQASGSPRGDAPRRSGEVSAETSSSSMTK
jgi:hypothetical protein